MGKYFIAEKGTNRGDNNGKNDARRSLNNYVNQLKIHFDLEENEIIYILESVAKSKKNNCFIKKWWHLWK